MKKKLSFFTALFLSANIIAFADSSDQVFTLKDGSQIKGTLSGVNNDVYTVKTPIIGDIHIAKSDVVSINSGNLAQAAPVVNTPTLPSTAALTGSAPNFDQQIAASQQKLMSNPDSMATLQEMMQDPEIMQALQDPALVQAVTSHDYQGVSSNPKVQAMLQNPKMQALLQKLAAQQNSSPQ